MEINTQVLRIRMLRLTATMLSLGKLIFSNLQESAKPVGITGTGQGKNQMPLWVIRYNQKKKLCKLTFFTLPESVDLVGIAEGDQRKNKMSFWVTRYS